MEHGALKFQAGTPDVAGPVGLAAAIDFLTAMGKDATWRHDQELVRHGLARLREVKGLRIIGPTSAQNRVPVFTFAIDGKSPLAIADGAGCERHRHSRRRHGRVAAPETIRRL